MCFNWQREIILGFQGWIEDIIDYKRRNPVLSILLFPAVAGILLLQNAFLMVVYHGSILFAVMIS